MVDFSSGDSGLRCAPFYVGCTAHELTGLNTRLRALESVSMCYVLAQKRLSYSIDMSCHVCVCVRAVWDVGRARTYYRSH